MGSQLNRFWCFGLCRLLWLLAAFWAAPAYAATCAPATSQGTAPASWQTYCWLDFSTYNDTTARTAAGQAFAITLSDGATLTFTVRTTGTPAIVSRASPSWTGAAVGNTAFLGIPGSPILYQQAGGTNVITISNIAITPPVGVAAASAYAFVAADAESTNNGESLSFNTNGGGWTILDQVNPISGSLYPSITGVGTATFTETGVAGTVGGYIVGSNNPTTITTTLVGGGLQGAMFAVRFASMRLTKQISGARINAADQFRYTIAATGSGTALASGTSTGSGNGPFLAASVSLATGISLTLSETMATGSVSALAKYSSRLTCTNGTAGSPTSLPTNVSTTSFNFGPLQFGDAVQCTFTNTAFPHITLTKALGSGGRQLAGDQFTLDIRAGTASIASTTTTGTGTTVTNGSTAQTQVAAGTAYSFAETAAGTTTLGQYVATLGCTNAATGSSTTLPNTMSGTVTPAAGDIITCTITNTKIAANATLTATKFSTLISDPVNGTTNPKMIPGARLTYTISISNSGPLPVDSSTIFILDPLPSGIAYDGGIAPSFVDGTPSSGLSWNAATDIRFSNSTTGPPASFAACTYTPGAGVDTAVRYVCIRPSGVMAGASTGQPNFAISFGAQIR